MNYGEDQKDEAIKRLKNYGIKQGNTIFSYVRSVAPSGMSRQIKFFIAKDSEIYDITRNVAVITDNRFKKDNWTLSISGCGMDMCFAVVYNLAEIIFRNEEPDSADRKTDKGYWLNSVNFN